MYNSHVVGGLVKIWKLMLEAYEDSLVKKIIDGIRNFIFFITRDSRVVSFFRDSKPALGNSYIYRSYSWFVGKLNDLMDKINSKITSIQDNSLVDRTIDQLVGSYKNLVQSILVFSIFFSIGILGQPLIYDNLSFELNIIAGLVIVISHIMLDAGENIVHIFKNSYFINRFSNLISLEEEGSEQWW